MFEDRFNPNEPNAYDENEFDKLFEDPGLNIIYRKVRKPGDYKFINKKIKVYTSDGYGSKIRDAETGVYYDNIVGTADEDLFYKVILATGECKSKNGSTTLFYVSPDHYMKHLHCTSDPEIIDKWQKKFSARLAQK
jgi:hypothetical protein